MQDELVAAVLAAADGEIIGRIRLQKIFYLLEQSGLGSGASFHYHHYGPYSRDLDGAVSRAEAFRGVREEMKYRQVDGMPYSVFTLAPDAADAAVKLGRIKPDRARALIGEMKSTSSTVLELAATIHWLATKEKVADWRAELIRRKGPKTQHGRTQQAVDLLERVGLPVP